MQDYDASLGIFITEKTSEESVLIEKLKTKFKDKYLDVLVFSNLNNIDLSKLNYLIIDCLNGRKDLNEIKSMLNGLECKTIVLFPQYIKLEEKFVADTYIKDLLDINNIGVILVPELLGEGVKYDPLNISHDLIMQTLISERIKINNSGNLINVISVSKLVEIVVKETFSFGISGQILALIGPRRGPKGFLINCLGVSEDNIIIFKSEPKTVEVFRTISTKIEFSLNNAVKKTKASFLEKLKDSDKLVPIVLSKKRQRFSFAKILKVILVFLSFLILPFLLLIISFGFLFFSVKTSLSNTSMSEKLINYSLKSVLMSQNISLGIPFYYDYSNILYKSAFLVRETLELSKIGNKFAGKIMGKEEYDLVAYSDNFSATLDRIHTDIGFLQSDINELNGIVGNLIKKFLISRKINIDEYKNKVYLVRNFASRVGTLLGMDKPAKYLILFQNNMELRPTGGFIGSFALVSFDKGRMSEIVVNDIYSADGQLKGHVDPPEPIRVYLGEGGWALRDSNWDPDFPTTAKKVEWFLDKEINTQVDGVIAIDLNFVQKLLKITGPITLSDFNKTITSDNLYTNTQSEVESNFFPGSIKKTSFLVSLSKSLMTEIQLIGDDRYFALIREIYNSLEERHIQFYFHDFNAQKAIDDLKYSGQVDMITDCGLRCLYDKYSVIDANLGVNKSNMFIKRTQEINLNISKQSVSHELFVTYQNTASQAVGNAGIYKNYARVLLPIEAKIIGVRLYDTNGNFEDLNYDKTEISDRQEIGFLLNILPGDFKKVQIVWNIDSINLSNGGEYRLTVRKQAGTDNDGLKINIKNNDLTLTGRAPSVYTTTLERDFSLKLFLK